MDNFSDFALVKDVRLELLLVVILASIFWTLRRLVLHENSHSHIINGNDTKVVNMTISRQFKKLLEFIMDNKCSWIFITLWIPGALGCEPDNHAGMYHVDVHTYLLRMPL